MIKKLGLAWAWMTICLFREWSILSPRDALWFIGTDEERDKLTIFDYPKRVVIVMRV